MRTPPRDLETRLKDGMIACRLVVSQLANNKRPSLTRLAKELRRPKSSVIADLDLYVAEGDDAELIESVVNWRRTSNRAVPVRQREALVNLFIEIRDSQDAWGFSNEKQLCTALGLPTWTMRKWLNDHAPEKAMPFEFNVRLYFDEYIDAGLFREALRADKFHVAERDIQLMRLDLLSERLDAIREIH